MKQRLALRRFSSLNFMKKIFLIIMFYVIFFSSNAFAFIEFKQEKDISSDTNHLRGITFKLRHHIFLILTPNTIIL